MQGMRRERIGDVELAVEDRGHGRPLVLLHGFPLDHSMWQAQLEALSARYRVIAPDLRGFGHSGITEGTVTMEQMARDVAELTDRLGLGQRVALCGLSMGGYVAFQFWRHYADRLDALILCDTRAEADDPQAAAARHETAQQVLAEGTAKLAESMLPKLLAPASQKRAELVEAVRQMILHAPPRGVAAAQRGMAERPDTTALLPHIRCPVLVLVGQQDAITPPEQMRRLAQAIPQAQLVVIPDAGHLAPMENPRPVNEAIAAFLDALPTAPE